MLPTFLGIGTQRAATTWLFNCLKEHPDVYIPEIKEVSFFSSHYSKGIEHYASFFRYVENEKAVGEISPEYIYTEGCHQLIYKHLPNIKMILILRNPIDRAYSVFEFFSKKNGSKITFEAFIESNPEVIEAGLYSQQLKKYFSLFDRNQFLILLFDELSNDNLNAIKNVYEFLEIDTEFCPSWINQYVNTELFPNTKQFLKKHNLDWVIQIVKKTPLNSLLRLKVLKTKQFKKKILSIETKKKLIDFYKKPNIDLGKLLNKDLHKWNRISL